MKPFLEEKEEERKRDLQRALMRTVRVRTLAEDFCNTDDDDDDLRCDHQSAPAPA